MEFSNKLNSLIGILGLIVSILGILYAFYQSWVISKSVKISTLFQIRTQINRLEEEKNNHPRDSSQWKAMHHTQQDLESLHKSLKLIFNVKDSSSD